MKKNERFTDTYNRYGDLIFWYAKRRLSNEELSKECTQQVFLKYYEHMDVISEEMVKAWLLTCCKNEIIDYFRKIERRKGFENIDAPEVEVHICSQDNAEYVVERLNREAFYTEVLTALRKKERKLVSDCLGCLCRRTVTGRSSRTAWNFTGDSSCEALSRKKIHPQEVQGQI